MNSLRKLFAKLKLRVNETKSKVRRATDAKFLGFSFWISPGGIIRRRVAPQAIGRMKERVRELIRRSAGRSLAQLCARLGGISRAGGLTSASPRPPGAFSDLDRWIRHRLRAVQLKHWKPGTVIYRELIARGAPPHLAKRVAANSRSWWPNSAKLLHHAMPNRLFADLGVPRLAR